MTSRIETPLSSRQDEARINGWALGVNPLPLTRPPQSALPARSELTRGGFLLGDGTLSYGREDIVESYYTAHLWRGVSASGGLQYIDHPITIATPMLME